ncbi:hypothetical protein [Gluconobacter japonicus]|uniref:hypothetical protein n=1 Tax=Gluconobacter japonicus TaxID=376620 RepID=UPI0039EC2125
MTTIDYERSDRVVGVLYAEDFDFPSFNDVPAIEVEEHDDRPEILSPSYTEDDLEEARRLGEETGRREEQRRLALEKKEWHQSIEKKTLDLIEQLNAQSVDVVRKISEEAVTVLIAQMSALFPSLLKSMGVRERDAVMNKILPPLKRLAKIRIEAREDEINYLSSLCLEAGDMKLDCHVNDALAPGDFCFSWSEGKVFRNAGVVARSIISEFEKLN